MRKGKIVINGILALSMGMLCAAATCKSAPSASPDGVGAVAGFHHDNQQAPFSAGQYFWHSCTSSQECRRDAVQSNQMSCVDREQSYCACDRINSRNGCQTGTCVWQVRINEKNCACIPGSVAPCRPRGVKVCSQNGDRWGECS